MSKKNLKKNKNNFEQDSSQTPKNQILGQPTPSSSSDKNSLPEESLTDNISKTTVIIEENPEVKDEIEKAIKNDSDKDKIEPENSNQEDNTSKQSDFYKDSDLSQEENFSNTNFHVVDKEIKYSKKEIFGLSIIIFFIVLFTTFIIFTLINLNNKNIVNGVSILGIDVSKQSKEDAIQSVKNVISQKIPEEISLKHNDYETSISTENLEIKFDVESAVNDAYSIGRSGNILQNDFEVLKTLASPTNIQTNFTINEDELKNSLSDISSKLPDTVIQSSYYIENGNLILTKGRTGNIVDVDEMAEYIINEIKRLTVNDGSLDIITLEQSPNELNIEAIHNEIYKQASDAYFTEEPYAVYPSENGLDFAISLEEAKAMLQEPKNEYSIPLKILYPNVTTNMIGPEAFPDLLSNFSTSYSTRDKDRTTNLKLAADKINGKVVMPGEIFSYNTVVGERTIAAGYKEAPIYVSGQVVDGLGGGICQITSTLYNAVVLANLEIVERSNHQFVPSYVTASRDATVVYGSIDFKFKNNRNYPIKILCSVNNGVANFQLFGLKTDNEYQVDISSRIVSQTSNYINSEAYKILKQNGQVVSTTLLSRDTYKRH